MRWKGLVLICCNTVGQVERGEIYGLAPVPERFRLNCLGPTTPVPGLYLTGADTVILGVTGALFGGALAASSILGRNLMSAITRRRPAQHKFREASPKSGL